jgi:hypothetical protein
MSRARKAAARISGAKFFESASETPPLYPESAFFSMNFTIRSAKKGLAEVLFRFFGVKAGVLFRFFGVKKEAARRPPQGFLFCGSEYFTARPQNPRLSDDR